MGSWIGSVKGLSSFSEEGIAHGQDSRVAPLAAPRMKPVLSSQGLDSPYTKSRSASASVVEALIAVVCLASLAPPPIEASDGTHGTARQEIVVDTVRGRPVVTTRFPERGGDAGTWHLVEELKLGNVLGDGPEGFGDVADLAVDSAGGIYVLDVGSKEVRVFGRDGTYLRGIGSAMATDRERSGTGAPPIRESLFGHPTSYGSAMDSSKWSSTCSETNCAGPPGGAAPACSSPARFRCPVG